jgi:hypothetical protein
MPSVLHGLGSKYLLRVWLTTGCPAPYVLANTTKPDYNLSFWAVSSILSPTWSSSAQWDEDEHFNKILSGRKPCHVLHLRGTSTLRMETKSVPETLVYLNNLIRYQPERIFTEFCCLENFNNWRRSVCCLAVYKADCLVTVITHFQFQG